MTAHLRLPFPFRAAAMAACVTLFLPACSVWTAGVAPRTSVSLSAPASAERSAQLQRLVADMDAQAFPQGGKLTLKLSYQLSPALPSAERDRQVAAAPTAGRG